MVEIKKYKSEYLPDVFKLLQQLWPNKQVDMQACGNILEKGNNNPNQAYLCLLIDNKVMGFCSLHIANSLLVQGLLGYIDELIIDESLRGKGYGKIMLAEIEKTAHYMNCFHIKLISAFHRNAAHRFYEENGYKKTAYLFEKELNHGSESK